MAPPRFHVTLPVQSGALRLPDAAARHVRVLRLNDGDALTLFNGQGGEWDASVRAVRRDEVIVDVTAHRPLERELPWPIHLAVGAPTNDRMDALVEKATELGAASIQPLTTERSVLRVAGDRAVKKMAHWQAVAVAASEQSGRNRVPVIHPMQALGAWLQGLPAAGAEQTRWLLSPGGAPGLPAWRAAATNGPSAASAVSVCFLSGPEGGLSATEEADAARHGFVAVNLGSRILRADTAPLAALAAWAAWAATPA